MSSLHGQARRFAEALSASVSGFLGRDIPFEADNLAGGDKVSVQDEGAAGITLEIDGSALLSLAIVYRCTWDGAGHYLAVDSSKISVHPSAKPQGDPLFRFEYERENGDLPVAHLHVHAHRDRFSHVMALAAAHGQSKRRARAMNDIDQAPTLSQLHFPLGGHRFRPCLEDVLEFLQLEFGVDCAPGWRQYLQRGRADWRRQQVAASVRDCPGEAARALQELGWEVTRGPGATSVERSDRLTCL